MYKFFAAVLLAFVVLACSDGGAGSSSGSSSGGSSSSSSSGGPSSSSSSGGADASVEAAPNTYALAGSIKGLAGSGLTLKSSAGEVVSVPKGATSFAFTRRVVAGDAYEVTVDAQPVAPTQVCSVANGSGTVAADVTNIELSCTTSSFRINVTVKGLLGTGLVLQNNGADDLPIATSGGATVSAAFSAKVESGQPFAVTVRTSPVAPNQGCAVGAGSGVVGSADLDVQVTCLTNAYTVGGVVTGLQGAGLILQNNGAGNLPIVANGPFSFAMPIASGGSFSAGVLANPTAPWQTCTVTPGTESGTVVNANITSVAVVCTTNQYAVGGTVSGLAAGASLVLQNSGADDVTLSTDGSFVFPSLVRSGSTYAVTVKTQPAMPSQTCAVTRGAGTVGGANVGDVGVACTTNKYFLRGTLTGLPSGTLHIQNSAILADLILPGNGPFAFPNPVPSGSHYDVGVVVQPDRILRCRVRNGVGTVGAADVIDLKVICSRSPFIDPAYMPELVVASPAESLATPTGGLLSGGGPIYWSSGGDALGPRLIVTFDNGAVRTTTTYSLGRDYRSVMFVGGRILSRSAGSNVIEIHSFDDLLLPSPFRTLAGPAIAPDSAVSVSLSSSFVAQNGGTLLSWSYADGSALPSVPLVGFGTQNGEGVGPAAVRSCFASRYLLTYSNGVVSAWDPPTGERLGTVTLVGANVGMPGAMGFGCDGGRASVPAAGGTGAGGDAWNFYNLDLPPNN